jgi:pimeloyl-ACP methyl ester carboxylesterase
MGKAHFRNKFFVYGGYYMMFTKQTLVYRLKQYRLEYVLFGLIILIMFIPACTSIKKSIYNTEIALERFRSGLSLKTVHIDEHEISYMEGGKGETVLLVHGYSSNKEIWIRFARRIKKHYHIIAMDLPGHGNSTFLMNASYSISSQVDYLKKMVNKLNLQKFHMVGNSMGGAISLYFTHQYQSHIKTLALFNSGGVNSPHPSEFRKGLNKGENLFFIETKEDFNHLLDLSMASPPFLPWPIKSVLFQNRLARNEINKKIFKDISEELWKGESFLKNITVPVFILWGQDDHLIDVSCVDIFHRNIPNSSTVILEKTGHCPMIEKSKETAKHYLNFLQTSLN